ncbi:MAG TPA: hypothetical protein DD491_17875, partial [Halieaceae bacterium]|nr:hypothetical protein [Halieaceae bacterium]
MAGAVIVRVCRRCAAWAGRRAARRRPCAPASARASWPQSFSRAFSSARPCRLRLFSRPLSSRPPSSRWP